MIEFTCPCGYTKRMAEFSTIWDMPVCPRCKNHGRYGLYPHLLTELKAHWEAIDNGSVTKPETVSRGGRPKKHENNAEKQREYRQRQKALRNQQ